MDKLHSIKEEKEINKLNIIENNLAKLQEEKVLTGDGNKVPFTLADSSSVLLGNSTSFAKLPNSVDFGSFQLFQSSNCLIPSNLTSTVNGRKKRKASGGLPIGSNGQIQADCLICSDRATGKHYGSVSCDGCKGFFRRTIRKKHSYICRFNLNCVVDKDQRNSCRRCRFEKCLTNGMRPEAVQLERDRIAATRRSNNTKLEVNIENSGESTNNLIIQTSISSPTSTISNDELIAIKLKNAAILEQKMTIQRLMNAERILTSNKQNKEEKNEKDQINTKNLDEIKNNCKLATTEDVTNSMHQQLILLVEWAKQLEEFRRLSLFSQIALLRHFSAQHLVICAAYRSYSSSKEDKCNGIDAIWLANDRCVPRDAPKIPDVNRVVARILDHLTTPMSRLHIEDKEFVALKAIAFFDPMAKDIEELAKIEVEKIRQQIMTSFEYQVTETSKKHLQLPNRLGNLLLLLPPLMAIGRDLVEEAQLAKLFGLANVDELMAELLLPEDAETRSYSRLKTNVTSSIVQSNITSPTPPATSPQILQISGITTLNQSFLAIPTPIYSSTSSSPLMLQIGCCTTNNSLLSQQQTSSSFGQLKY
ncbi:hypothetical protein Mgra_00006690 [Meloidogyne graminicola]|uniref:Nuclear receptor n=1 Tax=Meloidogyne graminicola TaxID=189291 RepID=A0A8S9ZKY6_9BILA|nr:hypothetical protein Mgra_00006690 [Meloidogyne graminicola]